MNITNYKTGEYIGTSTSVDVEAYEKTLAADNTGTGAVRAGDWISKEELNRLGINADLTIYAEWPSPKKPPARVQSPRQQILKIWKKITEENDMDLDEKKGQGKGELKSANQFRWRKMNGMKLTACEVRFLVGK